MVNIIFASGVIRTQSRFKHSVIDFFLNQNVNRIVLSVWVGELDKFIGLRKFLEEHNVEIVESSEPQERKVGFIDHQMKSLNHAIVLFDENDLIFKTRCDLYIDKDFFNKLLENQTVWSQTQNDEFKIFSNRIWIMYFEYTKPFYLSDEAFCGRKQDIKLLINFSNYEKYNIGVGITHIRRYIHPFLRKYPILENYLYDSSSFACLGCKNRLNNLKNLLNCKYYCAIYYLFIRIMYSNFYVSYPGIDVTTVYYDSTNRVRNDKFLSNLKRKYINCDRGAHIFIFEQKIIDNLACLTIDTKDLPNPLFKYLKNKFSYKQIIKLNMSEKKMFIPKYCSQRIGKMYFLRHRIQVRLYNVIKNEITTSPFKPSESMPARFYFANNLRRKLLILCNKILKC